MLSFLRRRVQSHYCIVLVIGTVDGLKLKEKDERFLNTTKYTYPIKKDKY